MLTILVDNGVLPDCLRNSQIFKWLTWGKSVPGWSSPFFAGTFESWGRLRPATLKQRHLTKLHRSLAGTKTNMLVWRERRPQCPLWVRTLLLRWLWKRRWVVRCHPPWMSPSIDVTPMHVTDPPLSCQPPLLRCTAMAAAKYLFLCGQIPSSHIPGAAGETQSWRPKTIRKPRNQVAWCCADPKSHSAEQSILTLKK